MPHDNGTGLSEAGESALLWTQTYGIPPADSPDRLRLGMDEVLARLPTPKERGQLVPGHLLHGRRKMVRFPHVCPGDGCAVRYWIEMHR